MTIRTKIIASLSLVFVLFAIAVGAALLGMQTVSGRFASFLQTDLALQQAASSMYADGLQGGQALRNIVLNPGNATSYKNLEKATADFEASGRAAAELSAGDAADLKLVQGVLADREKLVALQTRIVALAKQDQAAAIAAISDEETPLWRSIRGRLLEFVQAKKNDVAQTRAELADVSRRMFQLSVGLAIAALLAGAGSVFWLVRHLMGQLGGEPLQAARVARAVADGDLTQEVAVAPGDHSSMMAAMAAMRANLTSVVTRIRQGTDTIATASGQIAAGNQDLSQRTEEQASSLEETAASMEQLTGTVKQNADNARQANQLAQSAADVAVKGGTVVGQVVDTMASINESSKKIVDIISVIDGIAFQTNILALNAAVEAARAGEQGRGFAVVAAEVRSLAQRSAAAAKEIKALIDDSVGKVDAGSQLVGQAGATMQEIVGSIKRVTDIMGEIAAASQEQTRG
ncbi:methyl-accepting chemotaxis protein, partial [Ramlibacter sp.]|uniref:methyl-accepting chemotaxis protein n=1 Tax=Ramlibacter sp. TaxID=1917967 RepID=UPI002C6C3A34